MTAAKARAARPYPSSGGGDHAAGAGGTGPEGGAGGIPSPRGLRDWLRREGGAVVALPGRRAGVPVSLARGPSEGLAPGRASQLPRPGPSGPVGRPKLVPA